MTVSREWSNLPAKLRAAVEQHQAEAPVDLAALARGFGLSVKAATLAPGISGEIRPEGNSFVIRVNRHDAAVRQRFTVAHEIAHFLLHQSEIGKGITDDVLYRSSLSGKIEAEANRLAADILMPDHLVQRIKANSEVLNINDIPLHLSKRFGVSESAMKIKLGL
ncbi:ImmA/IrrE family metallo-endopeptidase [Sphingobium terrigena]|uniref:ImmA/IrrE family metallo-endopeptidase n=1 Tax=Sphingobium terrigena TaxID=2304063 RepID=A0A418YRK3_9SPHN|nr:ImmA/IrrE family metallo-endopeptidase [Sphingobium terrigena]RJG54299.1 ImmA/IrrE family metallo-endopeptidase [Sphingobium terrigena]